MRHPSTNVIGDNKTMRYLNNVIRQLAEGAAITTERVDAHIVAAMRGSLGDRRVALLAASACCKQAGYYFHLTARYAETSLVSAVMFAAMGDPSYYASAVANGRELARDIELARAFGAIAAGNAS